MNEGTAGGVITNFTTTAPAANGLTLATGDITFDIDLSAKDGTTGSETETVQIILAAP